MGKVRFVQPTTRVLQLSHDDWIEVKDRLSVGEERLVMAHMVGNVQGDGSRKPNLDVLGMGEVAAYLVDWSFIDAKGKSVPIDDEGKKLAALKALDPDTYREIEAAIDEHKKVVEKEVAESKKTRAGSPEPVVT